MVAPPETPEEVSAWFPGGRFTFRGREVFPIMMLVILGLAMAYIVWESGHVAAQAHREIVNTQIALIEELQIQSYILSLPPDGRPRLRPPEKLLDRLSEGERRRLEKEGRWW